MTWLLILVPAVLTAAFVVFAIRRNTARGTRVFGRLAERFGLRLVPQRNAAGTPAAPFAEGVYRGRAVRLRDGTSPLDFDATAAHLRRRLQGQRRERLVPERLKAFAYVEVACTNPSDLAMDVRAGAPTKGPDGAPDFAQSFSVAVAPGQEPLAQAVLSDAIREELGRTLTSRFVHPFHALVLAGPTLLYVENRWAKEDAADRLARMVDLLCDVAERVDALPAGAPAAVATPA